jgi:hypothetical protein
MANSDAHLTGGIMALIVMSLIFDDDDQVPSRSDDEVDQGRDEKGDRKG